ncbi:MAG: MBL fold metallo-hydrolase [Gemmatimonadota bacterium]|nr:MAG: MBL fold metallo-hydrolase [Gemmatimonadota bacterium]
MTDTVNPPDHHDPEGGFRNPWPLAPQRVFTGLLRWVVTRTVGPRIRRTPRGSFPRMRPAFGAPRARPNEVSLTWVGHATFLLQIGGKNVLTDPVWSNRCSPVPFAGPRRYMPPGIPFSDLPPVDLVLLSHDHYDHLDARTVRRIVAAHPEARWLVPLGLASFVSQLGARYIAELDWWAETHVDGLRLGCVPAQHFSARGMRRNRSLWCGWLAAFEERRCYFVGDTGRHPDFGTIGSRLGPFDLVLMPIGSYDPRWAMAPVHLNPEEAVDSFVELSAGSGQRCSMVAMHWGTFKLTFEPMTEPPERAQATWLERGLPRERLWIMAHGETRWVE